MRLAMVIQRFRPSFGGQGVQVESLCTALAARGVEPTVYTAMPESGAPEEEYLDGYRVRRLSAEFRGQGRHWPSFGVRAYGALRAESPDLVHVHALTDALYGSWLYCRRRRRPLVFEMTLLGDDDPDAVAANPSSLRWLRNRLYRSADAYVAMSRAFEPAYERAGLPQDRFHVIPQGVDAARFSPPGADTRAAARAQFGLPADAPVVVFVGSLIERKGLDILLRSWPMIRQRTPGARLLLVGPGGPEEHDAAQAWAALSDEDRNAIVQPGRIDAIEGAFHAADVFAFPSRREGFGTVIIEAMATGLPCVIAELPGITDFIFASAASSVAEAGRGTDGVVVPQDDPDALAAAVAGLAAVDGPGATIGSAARSRAVWFDINSIADSYVDLYRELLA